MVSSGLYSLLLSVNSIYMVVLFLIWSRRCGLVLPCSCPCTMLHCSFSFRVRSAAGLGCVVARSSLSNLGRGIGPLDDLLRGKAACSSRQDVSSGVLEP